MSPVPLVQVVRSGVVESVHLGDVAVCDASGRLLAHAGDPNRVVFARSCMKPVQAAVSLAAIGTDVRLTDRHVAVMCSSHNGEPSHIGAVRELLARGGVPETALRTPAARPMDPDAAAAVRTPKPVFHDCSGNHAGMLVASCEAGWPLETYRARSHPHHRRMLPLVRALTDAEPVQGVDGCGIPVHALPLRALATMYARLAEPSALPDAPFLARAVEAMRARSYLVGGRGREDTAIMQATSDIVAKGGAEALNCAFSGGAGIGIAVKVADGGYRAVGPATIAVLDALGLLTPAARRSLSPWSRPTVLGGARPVGRLEPIVTLSREPA